MKKKTIIYSLAAIIAIALGGWIIHTYTSNEPTKEIVKTVYVGADEEILDNFSRKDAVDSLVELLKSATKDVDGKDRTIMERLDALEEGEDIYKVLRPETIAKIYFEEKFGADEYNRQATASTILVQAKLASEMNEDLEPLFTLYDEIIMLDEKRLNAQIPLDVIVGVSTGYAFEMVYVDKEWKLNPYSIIMSMKLSELILNSQQ